MSMFCAIAPKAIYKALPADIKKELASKTGQKYAVQSAYHLYSLLSNPEIVGKIPEDVVKTCLNQSKQIKFSTRLALSVRHFRYVLTSNYKAFGQVFKQLAKHPELDVEAAEARVKQYKEEIQKALAMNMESSDSLGKNIQEKIKLNGSCQRDWLQLHKDKQAIALRRQKLREEWDSLQQKRPAYERPAYDGFDDLFLNHLFDDKGNPLKKPLEKPDPSLKKAYKKWERRVDALQTQHDLEDELLDQQEEALERRFHQLEKLEEQKWEKKSWVAWCFKRLEAIALGIEMSGGVHI